MKSIRFLPSLFFTIKVSKYYSKKLTEKGIENQILDLCALPVDFIYNGLYGKKNDAFFDVVDKYVLDINKLVIISFTKPK